MTLLIISPDYASHLYPLATLGAPWRAAGERVVVASGPATASIVDEFGFERVDLRLGRGSNPGVIRAEEQPRGEDDALRGFFDATRVGMVATLAFQARARRNDLLWNPLDTARDVLRVVDEVAPTDIIVDHLAFSARLALVSAGVRYADVVLGHPATLPVEGEVYGYPPAWPVSFGPSEEDLLALRELCEAVRDDFTDEWNTALLALDAHATPSRDAFAETGDVLLLNFPRELHDPERTRALPGHAFLGSSVRAEPVDADVAEWIASSDTPLVYVSFGSFLSVRGDVLARVVEGLRDVTDASGRPVRVALASGSSDPAMFGEIPDGWLVREFLPQVALLGAASAAVTHGGNNSVTEAMTAGVPLLVLPFSTDQFAGAASLEDAGFAEAFDPNSVSADEVRGAVSRLLRLDGDERSRLDTLSQSLVAEPGASRAWSALRVSVG